jgi:hypothetical protein
MYTNLESWAQIAKRSPPTAETRSRLVTSNLLVLFYAAERSIKLWAESGTQGGSRYASGTEHS